MERGRGRGRATKKRASMSSDPSHHHQHHHDHHVSDQPPAASFPEAASSSQPLESRSPPVPQADLLDLSTPGASSHASRGGKLGTKGSHSAQRQRTASPSTSSDVNSRTTPRSDRPARSATFNESSLPEAPSDQLDGLPPKRARTNVWPESDGPADEAHSKGGHSLRKRARVDYSRELVEIDYLTGRPTGRLLDINHAVKSTVAPPTRGRKRLSKPHQGEPRSGDDAASDGPSSAATQPRRRRPTQSPAPTRGGGSSRRRPPSRKSTTAEPSPFHVDQPSDNEVQDTILVGVSMDGINGEDSEASEASESFDDHRSSSRDSGTGPALVDEEVEPATPQPSTILQVDKAVSVASENEAAIENDLVGGEKIEIKDAPTKDDSHAQPDLPPPEAICEAASVAAYVAASPAQASVAASPVQSTSDEKLDNQANDNPQPFSNVNETETSPGIFQVGSTAAGDRPSPAPDHSPLRPHSPAVSIHSPLPHENNPAEDQIAEDMKSPFDHADSAPADSASMDLVLMQSPPPKINTPSPSSPTLSSPTLVPELAIVPVLPEHHVPIPPAPPTITRGWGRLRRALRSHEPARLGELEKVYQAPTPFATALGLSPYLEEDVLLPGPFSETIQREDVPKTEATPMPTPAPTPPPPEARAVEVTWDGCTPLTVSQFYQLWKQEQKRCEALGQPQPSWKDFHNCCVRQIKAAQGDKMETSAVAAPKAARMGPKVLNKQLPTLPTTASFEDTPQGSQVAESEAPTAAPSPAAAIEEDMDVDAEGEDELYVEEADSLPKASITEPVEITRNPTKQYSFPKLRDPQEFVDALKDSETLTKEEMYERSAAAVEALVGYEQEFHELKKIVDDEENSKRRVAHDKTLVNWENRQKADEPTLFRRHFDEQVKGYPTFEVRGARAPAAYVDDPVLERQKQEDKISAQAHGFKYNSHPALVGRQNPEEQRWEMPENRLRERRKTEKGAELAEEGGDGKRVRRMPRNLSDQSKDPSRAGTPIAIGPGLRGKRKLPGSYNEDEETALTDAVPAVKPSGRGRGGGRGRGRGRGSRGGRGGRGASASAQPRDNFRTPSAERDSERTPSPERDWEQMDADAEVIEKPTSSRKRATRGAAIQQSPASLLPASPEPKAMHQRATKPAVGAEIAPSSFYSNYASVDSHADSRPSTASSAIAETVENTEASYSLREKRKRNFVLENDPVFEPRANKRARAAAVPKPETSEPKKKSPKRKGAAPQAAAKAPIPPPQVAPLAAHIPASAPPPSGGLQPPPLMLFNPPAPIPFQAPHGPYMHTFSSFPSQNHGPPSQVAPPTIAPAAKKAIKIKITNNGSGSQTSSRAVTPAAIAPNPSKLASKASRPSKVGAGEQASMAPGAAPGEEKSYTEMSKSEKMSYSMKRRWANGEMQGAVEKRRNTLANKKAEKAATGTNGSGNEANPRSTSVSASGTPTPVPVPNPFGMPPQTHNPAMAQQAPLQYPPGGLISQQGMVYYPPGGGPTG